MPKRWLVALALLGALAVVMAPTDDDGDDGPDEEPAHWELAEEPTPDDDVLRVRVTPAGCDGEVTGTVRETGDRVRVRIVVVPAEPCVLDVPHDVELRLDAPLGRKVIEPVDCPPAAGGSPPPGPGCPAPAR